MKSPKIRNRVVTWFFTVIILTQSLYSSIGASDIAWDDSNLAGMEQVIQDIESSAFMPEYPKGYETFKWLNKKETDPFVVSVGTSMSQTHQSDNTVSDRSIRTALQSVMKKLPLKKAVAWLKSPDRLWYVLRSLPKFVCANGHIIDPAAFDPKKDSKKIDDMFEDIASNRLGNELKLHICPECLDAITQEQAKPVPVFTLAHEDAMIAQINHLHVSEQVGCGMGLPNVRLSLEAADVMVPNSTELSKRELEKQANFINKLGNPLLFFHHYSNPQQIPDLFEKPEHIDWFANYCVEVLKLSPQISHVCPISQPVGFAFRVGRGTLPPFARTIDQEKYLKNIVNAQVAVSKKIKEHNENIKVLVSHQWKSMKPMHGSMIDPRRGLETAICKIAHTMYNGKFVSLMKPHMKHFDGIALSIYPALRFNLWVAEGDNTGGKVDYEAALEAIVETSKAFPDKDIYVVETGCNTADDDTKRKFIDMTLYACKVAREMDIPVKGVYFWGITNDKDFYSEWNSAPGSTHFGPFDRLDTANPTGSINAAGKYLKSILSPSN